MAADPSGNLFAAWLDLRAKGTQLYGARSTDGGEKWSPNVRVYSSPGGICAPSIAIAGDGTISVRWSNVIVKSHDAVHFDTAQKIGEGACLIDSGGLVIDRGTIWSAWRRDREVFLDRMGSPEARLGTGSDVAIASGSKGIYVAWTNGNAIEIHVPGAAQPLRIADQGAFVTLTWLADGILAAWEQSGSIVTQRIE